MELIEATASSGSEAVLIARAWRVEAVAPDVPERRFDEPPRHDLFEATTTAPQAPGFRSAGYLAAIDWSFERGAFEEYGPAKAWARPKFALVDDEAMSGWQRVMTVADSGSGISMCFPPTGYPAINTDLVVSLDREPTDEWIEMDSVTTVVSGGGAMTRTDVLDHSGTIGLATQTLLVGRHAK